MMQQLKGLITLNTIISNDQRSSFTSIQKAVTISSIHIPGDYGLTNPICFGAQQAILQLIQFLC